MNLLAHMLVLMACLITTTLGTAVPNVLLLVVDDLRPQLEAYGFNQSSPNIANFAKTATLFKSAYCQFAICSPSRASFLTGKRPATTQVYDLQTYFRNVPGLQNVVTMPQFFKNQGYRVAGGGKIFHPGAASGNDDDIISWTEPYYHSPNEHQFGGRGMSWQARTDPELNFPDAQIATNAMQQLRSLKDGPFFVAMGLHKPHLPFVFPASYLDRYPPLNETKLANYASPPALMPRVAWNPYSELKAYHDISSLNIPSRPGNSMPASKAQELRRAYWAATSFADAQIGRVLQELENLNLHQNTTVVLMSDHGWHLGDLGEWTKNTNFEPSNRVVLMIRDPSRPASAGQTVHTNVELLDVYPTVVDIANFTVPTGLEGKSLTPVLTTPSQVPAQWKDVAYSQMLRGAAMYANTPYMGYTMRGRDWRYTEWLRFNETANTADWNNVYATELYDHRNDTQTDFGYFERQNEASNAQYATLRTTLSRILQEQTTVRPFQAVSSAQPGTSQQSSTGQPLSSSSTQSTVGSPTQSGRGGSGSSSVAHVGDIVTRSLLLIMLIASVVLA